MPEIQKNIPLPDMSDVLSTYKRNPAKADNSASKGFGGETSHTQNTEMWNMPKCETPFEKKMYILHEGMKVFALTLNSAVNLVRVGAWCIAIFGSLFVALLATNKIDYATEILNKNIFSKWGKSIDVSTATTTQTGENQASLKSSVLSTAIPETPEIIAKKRATLLEARKVARLQQDKLKAAENSITQ